MRTASRCARTEPRMRARSHLHNHAPSPVRCNGGGRGSRPVTSRAAFHAPPTAPLWGQRPPNGLGGVGGVGGRRAAKGVVGGNAPTPLGPPPYGPPLKEIGEDPPLWDPPLKGIGKDPPFWDPPHMDPPLKRYMRTPPYGTPPYGPPSERDMWGHPTIWDPPHMDPPP